MDGSVKSGIVRGAHETADVDGGSCTKEIEQLTRHQRQQMFKPLPHPVVCDQHPIHDVIRCDRPFLRDDRQRVQRARVGNGIDQDTALEHIRYARPTAKRVGLIVCSEIVARS